MSNGVDFNENFNENLDVLENDLENLFLDLINIAQIEFESQEEFRQSKNYIMAQLKKSVMHLVIRMQRKRVFDRDIDR